MRETKSVCPVAGDGRVSRWRRERREKKENQTDPLGSYYSNTLERNGRVLDQRSSRGDVRNSQIRTYFKIEGTEPPGGKDVNMRKREKSGATSNIFSMSTGVHLLRWRDGKRSRFEGGNQEFLSGHINLKYSLHIQIEMLSSQMEVRQLLI